MGKKRRKKNKKTFVFGFESSNNNKKRYKGKKCHPNDVFAIADQIFKGRQYSANDIKEPDQETIS